MTKDVVLPGQARYTFTRVPTPEGALGVGTWRPRRSLDHPSAPVVVAVHGVTGNHRCWPFLVDSLPHVRVLAPDLRGRGESAGLTGRAGLTTHADDLIRILDHHGVERATLLGHSMGGFVAAIAAHRHPDRVGELVLVDGGLPVSAEIPENPEEASGEFIAHLKKRLDATHRTAEDAVTAWRMHPAFVGSWSPVVRDYATYDLGGRVPKLRSRVRFDAVVQDSIEVFGGTAHRTALDELRHRTQWLTMSCGLLGAAPGIYPPELLTHWVERYPDIEVHPVAELNHYTCVLSRRGGEVMAEAVQRVLDRTPVG